MSALTVLNKKQQFQIALALAYFTILFALLEAVFSAYYGINDESLSLFGFGIGSLIEVVSAIGVVQMIIRVQHNTTGNKSKFEKTALRITGTGFYILVFALVTTCIYNIIQHHKPETTFPGIIISLCSGGLMIGLVIGKLKTGRQLQSNAILADAQCTKVCVYTSIILLIASAIYTLTNLPYIDEAGTLGIAYFSFKEGKECFEKARNSDDCCCC